MVEGGQAAILTILTLAHHGGRREGVRQEQVLEMSARTLHAHHVSRRPQNLMIDEIAKKKKKKKIQPTATEHQMCRCRLLENGSDPACCITVTQNKNHKKGVHTCEALERSSREE
jgi:hypothetical protein